MKRHPGMAETYMFLRQALPNGITIAALGFGLWGLTFAAVQDFASAAGCVLIAALLDGCDGRVARAAGVSSKFGAELDSLSDAVCFGVVPAFILQQWALSDYGGVGLLAATALAGACALRLARFNVEASDTHRPSWTQHFFTGVPAPAGAFLALVPVYAGKGGILSPGQEGPAALAAAFIVAGLMVSTWPTFSAKTLSRKGLRLLFLPSMVLLAGFTAGLVASPWLTLTLAAAGYLLTLPFSLWRFTLHQRRHGQ